MTEIDKDSISRLLMTKEVGALVDRMIANEFKADKFILIGLNTKGISLSVSQSISQAELIGSLFMANRVIASGE